MAMAIDEGAVVACLVVIAACGHGVPVFHAELDVTCDV
jgi:hypothetical protein